MHDMKAYRDMAAEVHSFLTSEINELSALLQGEMSPVPTEEEARWAQNRSGCVRKDTKL